MSTRRRGGPGPGAVAQLDEHFPGITGILKIWFENYKGKGALDCRGFGDKNAADALLRAAEDAFAKAEAAER